MESNNFTNNSLEWYYHKIKNDKNCDFYAYLQVILESKNSYWNYRVASLCLTDKRIPANERTKYVIKHAEILFENNNLKYMIRFLNKIYSKPAYQEYIKTKKSIHHYEEELKQQTQKSRLAEQKKQEEILKNKSIITINLTDIGLNCPNKTAQEKSEYILTLEDPEYNYYAITNLEISITQKKKHFQKILESGDAYWNYKCVKKLFRIKSLETEEKVKLIKEHIEVVINSNNKEIISYLSKFLKNKTIYKEFTNIKEKSGKNHNLIKKKR